MRILLFVATAGVIFGATPVGAQNGGAPNYCRQVVIDACVKRLMTFRDPASGRAVQRGEAEQFCKIRTHGC